MTLVSASALSDARPATREAARAFFEGRGLERATVTPGGPLGFVAEGFAPTWRLQVSLHVSDVDDETGARRVVHADQLGIEPGRRFLAGIITPVPGARWPRPCRTYALELGSFAGPIAKTSLTLGGCPRALESLRGRVLFHVGKKAPPLFDFAGTLAAYRKAAGATSPLPAPIGKSSFFLGWKAAFAGPAGTARVRVRLTEVDSGVVRDEREMPIEPTWDSLGGGWEITLAPPDWPRKGVRYRLEISRDEAGTRLLAAGELALSTADR